MPIFPNDHVLKNFEMKTILLKKRTKISILKLINKKNIRLH